MDTSSLADLWQQATATVDPPDSWLILATAALALAAVLQGTAWRITRNAITIAHEAGHAMVALVTGRTLQGIRLHSDTSGVTVSRGKPTGPGMVFTSFAGYPAAPLLGLLAAAMAGSGRVTALLWLSLALLLSMLFMIRNVFGVVSVLGTGAVIATVSLAADDSVQSAFAYAFAWFLLLGGVRPIAELQRGRSRGGSRDSDADQLARLTGVPGLAWVGLFFVIALGSLALGGSWLLDGILDGFLGDITG